jgi:uncharacterized membrane protein
MVACLCLPFISSPTLRKLWGASLGILVNLVLCGTGFIINIPLCMVCYVSMHIFPRNVQHIATIAIVFTAMALLHMYYEMLDIIIMNMSTVSMLSFCK